MTKLVIGLVQTRDEAEVAAERIIHCGYTRQDISLLMTDATRRRCFLPQEDTKPGRSAFGNAVAMSVAVPGLGLVVAGPIAAVVASAVVGGGIEGLRGILIGAGIPRLWAESYEAAVQRGAILVGIYARSTRDMELLHLVLDDLSNKLRARAERPGRRIYDSVA
jgi:hypothetical protein